MGRKCPVIAIAMALATVMTIVACDGGSEPRMTVEEYAAACKELGQSFDVLQGWEEDNIEAVERAVSEAKKWNPPADLQEFHEATVRFAEWGLRAFRDAGFFDLMRDLEQAMEEGDQEKISELQDDLSRMEDKIMELGDQADEMTDEIDRVTADLSPTTRELLEDANCF